MTRGSRAVRQRSHDSVRAAPADAAAPWCRGGRMRPVHGAEALPPHTAEVARASRRSGQILLDHAEDIAERCGRETCGTRRDQQRRQPAAASGRRTRPFREE